MDVSKLTSKECYDILVKANAYAAELPCSDYAKSACKKAVKSGLFSDGDQNGTLDKPRAALERQEFAVILDRMGELGGNQT